MINDLLTYKFSNRFCISSEQSLDIFFISKEVSWVILEALFEQALIFLKRLLIELEMSFFGIVNDRSEKFEKYISDL